jgi:hypothetical protein
MGRFNSPVTIAPKNPIPAGPGVVRKAPDTVNSAGGDAYKRTLRNEIATVVLNCMLSDRFYTSAQENLAKLHDLVARTEAAGETEFLAKAAWYARHTHGLRTVSHILAGEIGDLARGAEWKRKFYAAIVRRPDDVTETLAYWNQRHPKARHPNAMTRGFAEALGNFDAYALAKYKGDGKGVSLIDAVNICHPKVGKGHAIHQLMNGTLKAADTWEKALSAAGTAEANVEEGVSKEEAVTEAKAGEWRRLLAEKKLGYLACLRNLRNIAEQAPDALGDALALISNEKAIAKAMIFPFQYRQAYEIGKEIGGDNGMAIQMHVAKAADISLSNIPKLPGRTLIALDDSGSMTSRTDKDGKPCIKIASIFAAALLKAMPSADYMQFSQTARYLRPDRVGMGVFALAQHIENTCQSSGTYFHNIFMEAAKAGKTYDRVIILSDEQGYGNHMLQKVYASYVKDSKQPVKLYSFDLAGEGTCMFPAEQVCTMAGFSDKVFTLMGQMEVDRNALVNDIEKVYFAPRKRAPVPAAEEVVVPKAKQLKRAPKGDKSAKVRRATKKVVKAKPKKK